MSIKDRILTKLTSMQFWLAAIWTPIICCVDFSTTQADVFKVLIITLGGAIAAKQIKKVAGNVKENWMGNSRSRRAGADDGNQED